VARIRVFHSNSKFGTKKRDCFTTASFTQT
jgi:hypothetical protein